jgi:hypothetical protein
MISKKLQEVLEDDFGMDIEEVDDDFNSEHWYFSVSYWENGQVFTSHQNIDSVRDLIADAAYRRPGEAYSYAIFDYEGNELKPNFSSLTLYKVR